MKNQLEKWEVGLGERIKNKEFSFDPEAFNQFETLLALEAAPAPEQSAAATPSANVFPPLLKLLVWSVSLLLTCAVLYYLAVGDREDPQLPPDSPTDQTIENPKTTSNENTTSVRPYAPAGNAVAAESGPGPAVIAFPVTVEPINTLTITPENMEMPAKQNPASLIRRSVAVRTIPLKVILPLPQRSPKFKMPSVTVSRNNTDKIRRNRRTLFPEVID